MDNSVGHAFALDESAAEHSAEHITAAFDNPMTANIAMSVATQAAKGVGLATGIATGIACSGAAVIAVAGVAYGAVRSHEKISRERAEEARRANQKAQDCQELLELTEDELTGMYKSYRGQHRALVGLRKIIIAKEREIRTLRSGATGSNVRRSELQFTRLNAELAHRDAQIRELSRNLVVKQSEVNSLTHERAERRAEVESLVIDLAGKDRDVGRLIQESEEKGSQIYRLAIEAAHKSGSLRRREIQIRALTAELSQKEVVHAMQDTARTRGPERGRVHTLFGEIAFDQVEARLDQARADDLAGEMEGLRKNLSRCRKSVVAQLARKDKELTRVRQQAIAQEDFMMVEISEPKDICSQLDSAFHESSGPFQNEWILRETQQTCERDQLQERAERLSGDVKQHKQRLNEERARHEALVRETVASLQAKNAQLTNSLVQANAKVIAAESRAAHLGRRIAHIEARAEERVAGMEARYRQLAARAYMASEDFERKTAEVESLTRHLADAEAKAATTVATEVEKVGEGMETAGVVGGVGGVDDVEDVWALEEVDDMGEEVKNIEHLRQMEDMGYVEDMGEVVEVEDRVEGADTDDQVSAPMGQADVAQEAGGSIVPGRMGSITESRDSNGAYTTAMLVGEGDEMLLLPKGTRQGALMVLQGDFGVTMEYDGPNRIVSIKGATLEVQRSVVARLRSALVLCDPAYGQDPGYSFLVMTNMSPPPSADQNEITFSWWRGKVHTHCNIHGCVGDLVVPSDKRVGRPRPRQLRLTQDWDLFVWGPSWAVRDLMAVPPDDVHQAAKAKDKYEFLRGVRKRPDESAIREPGEDREGGAGYTREGMEEGTEVLVRMPRPALIAVASPQRLQEAVDQAVADVAAAAGRGAGKKSTGSSGESNMTRVKAWVNLVAGKVIISGQHPKEVIHVCQAMEASLEAWNRLEVTTSVSNRAGRDFRFHPDKLSDISQEVEVPLVVYIDGGLCGVTRHTEIRGRAQTEEIAVAARRKLVQMKEFGGPLWCKEMDDARKQTTGVNLEDRGGNPSQKYRATDGSRQDHLGNRHTSEVQPPPPACRPHQKVGRGVAHRQRPLATRGTIGGDYAMSGSGFGGGEYQGSGGNNYLPPLTPSPTTVPVAHYPAADMPPVTCQRQQLPRALVVQQQQQQHVVVERRMSGAGGVPCHHGVDACHVVPPGLSEQGKHTNGSMTRILPLSYAPYHGDAAAMHVTGSRPPPPAHAGPILHHQNVTPTGSAGFFTGGGGTFGGGEP